jgi:hypothetical protein
MGMPSATIVSEVICRGNWPSDDGMAVHRSLTAGRRGWPGDGKGNYQATHKAQGIWFLAKMKNLGGAAPAALFFFEENSEEKAT